MVERQLSGKRYFLAFILTTGIFLLGLFLGIILNNQKFDKIDDLQLQFRTQLSTIELQNALTQGDICNFNDVDVLVDELSKLGQTLTSMESQLGKHDKEVIVLKEYYELLEIRHMLYLKDYKEKCESDLRIIQFFYSNDEKVCADCESQGYILSYLRAKYPDLRIYSFDVDIDNPAIKALLRINQIKSVPSVVIDGKLYEGYKEKEFLDKELNIKDGK